MRRFTQIIVMAGLATIALTGTAFGNSATGKDFRSPDARDAAQSTTSVIDLRSPDARDAARGPAGSDVAKASEITDLRSPDARDPMSPSTFKPGAASTPHIVQVASNGFEWSDAGIGAAAMLGLIALCGGVLLLVSSRRRERHMPRTIG
jgi:hypothetical protein